MVQDVFDNECFPGIFENTDPITHQKVLLTFCLGVVAEPFSISGVVRGAGSEDREVSRAGGGGGLSPEFYVCRSS